METRLQELKKFEGEMRATMEAHQTQIQKITDTLNLNQPDLVNLQVESRDTEAVVDGTVKTLAEHSVMLEEIRATLREMNGKGKGVQSGSILTESVSPPMMQSMGHLSSPPPGFTSVRPIPPFTPPLAPISIPGSMHQAQSSYSPVFTAPNPPAHVVN